MTMDHVNKYLLSGSVSWMFMAGRLAMPIFAIVLAYQLARPGVLQGGSYDRLTARLAVYGLMASIPYAAMGTEVHAVLGGWWPLNILLTFLTAAWCVKLLDERSAKSSFTLILVFTIGGGLVEFWWPALILVISAWCYFRTPSIGAAAGVFIAMLLLGVVNSTQFGALSLVFVFAASRIEINMPRWRNIFYLYYVGHLMVIWTVLGCR